MTSHAPRLKFKLYLACNVLQFATILRFKGFALTMTELHNTDFLFAFQTWYVVLCCRAFALVAFCLESTSLWKFSSFLALRFLLREQFSHKLSLTTLAYWSFSFASLSYQSNYFLHDSWQNMKFSSLFIS